MKADAIDVPGPGEGRPPNAVQDGPRPNPDPVAEEWYAALDLLQGTAEVSTNRLGY
jgi:hypothetical protein